MSDDAFLAELRAVGRPLRIAGLVCVLLGAGLVMAARGGYAPPLAADAGYVALGAGWILFLAAIWRRTAWRRCRLKGD